MDALPKMTSSVDDYAADGRVAAERIARAFADPSASSTERAVMAAVHDLVSRVVDRERRRANDYIERADEQIRLVRAASERTLSDYLQRVTAAEALVEQATRPKEAT